MSRSLLRVAFVLALIVVGASSWLRLAGNGLGCTPWPACYGQAATAADVQERTATAAVRLVHRIAASAFALVALAVAVALWWRANGAQRAVIAALLLLTAVLALLGRYTPSPWPAVTLVNALGGLGLLALVAWLAGSLAPAGERRATRGVSFALALLAVALLLQAAGGTMISVRLAATACESGCTTAWVPGAAALWNPFLPGSAAELTLRPFGGAPLHVLHRIGGLLILVAAVVLCGSGPLRDSAVRPAPALWALGATVAAGVALAVATSPAWAGAAHMLIAGLSLAAFSALRAGSTTHRRDA